MTVFRVEVVCDEDIRILHVELGMPRGLLSQPLWDIEGYLKKLEMVCVMCCARCF